MKTIIHFIAILMIFFVSVAEAKIEIGLSSHFADCQFPMDGTLAYLVSYDFEENESRTFKVLVKDKKGNDLPDNDVKVNIPGPFAQGNRVDLTQWGTKGSFSVQVVVRQSYLCDSDRVNLNNIKVVTEPF